MAAEPVAPTRLRLIVFRFGVVYLGLFSAATQISGSVLPNLAFYYRGLGQLWPMREITAWVGDVFGLSAGLEAGSGGEPLFVWVQTGWLLVVSAVTTIVWSMAGRRGESHPAVHAWFRLFVRFALAAALFEYGMTKVIPTQFPPPSLTALVTPVGDLTLSAMLWASIGASPAYEIFTGCVELLAGLLLLTPRTTLLGALIGLGAVVQVFVLNMTYDIGLKLISFHLIVLALVLIAPDASRLADVFVRHRPAGIATEPAPLRSRRGNRLALAVQLAFGAYLVGMYAYINVSYWQVAGGGAPKSALYGIWNVETLAIDGEIRAPQVNDYDRRWRRVIFDAPDAVVVQRTDDSFARYGASIDAGRGTVALTKGGSRTWAAALRFDQPSPDRLVLDGEMDGYHIRAGLRLVELDTLRLLNSTFRWVRPHEQAQ